VRGLAGSRLLTQSSPVPRVLEAEPAQAAVFEDALAGVEAGRAGALGRSEQAEAVEVRGADIVVSDLDELLVRA
jgi:beta-phosphoglucomutase-like phosphatase (HAD superfamily)